jgi:hypothetical protein
VTITNGTIGRVAPCKIHCNKGFELNDDKNKCEPNPTFDELAGEAESKRDLAITAIKADLITDKQTDIDEITALKAGTSPEFSSYSGQELEDYLNSEPEALDSDSAIEASKKNIGVAALIKKYNIADITTKEDDIEIKKDLIADDSGQDTKALLALYDDLYTLEDDRDALEKENLKMDQRMEDETKAIEETRDTTAEEGIAKENKDAESTKNTAAGDTTTAAAASPVVAIGLSNIDPGTGDWIYPEYQDKDGNPLAIIPLRPVKRNDPGSVQRAGIVIPSWGYFPDLTFKYSGGKINKILKNNP